MKVDFYENVVKMVFSEPKGRNVYYFRSKFYYEKTKLS